MWTLQAAIEGEADTFRMMPGAIRTLGRATGSDFIVDGPLVSRVHCRLTVLPDGRLEVRDLQSTNGTYVNGTRVDTAPLRDGDRLRLGRVELLVRRELEAEGTPAAT